MIFLMSSSLETISVHSEAEKMEDIDWFYPVSLRQKNSFLNEYRPLVAEMDIASAVAASLTSGRDVVLYLKETPRTFENLLRIIRKDLSNSKFFLVCDEYIFISRRFKKKTTNQSFQSITNLATLKMRLPDL